MIIYRMVCCDFLPIAAARDIYRQVRQTRDMKTGELVGTDLHGNRYFENRDEQFGKDRFVPFILA